MVNPPADNADTIVDDQPTVLPEQGQEMREHTPRPQPPAPAPRLQTPEPRPRPRTPETHTLSGLEFLGRVPPQKHRPGARTLQDPESGGNMSDVDVEQQLLGKWAGGDSIPDVRLPDVPLPNVPLPNVALPDVPLHEERPDGSVGEQITCPRIAFGLGSGSRLCSFRCCNLFISGTD